MLNRRSLRLFQHDPLTAPGSDLILTERPNTEFNDWNPVSPESAGDYGSDGEDMLLVGSG
jgi:hypothetical protein